MPKKLFPRRPERKRLGRPRLDDDMIELAEVLDECRLGRNAEGWFALPWRDGWNAVHLAKDLIPPSYRGVVEELVRKRELSSGVYWIAGDLIDEDLREGNRLRIPALRCLQVLISHSDGGGRVYNDILRPAVDRIPLGNAEPHVIKWRCHDAIGVGPTLVGDSHDRTRRAFAIAWKRGLFAAAYALPRAI